MYGKLECAHLWHLVVKRINFRVCAGPVLFWRYFQGLGCWSGRREKGFSDCEICSPDFVPLSTCENSPIGLPLGCVSAAGMGERSIWDLHPYLSSKMRLHCVSALAVSWTPETGGILWTGKGWEHGIELSCWRRETPSVAMPLPNDPNEVFLSSEGVVFTQPEQGPYSCVLVSVKAGKLSLLRLTPVPPV